MGKLSWARRSRVCRRTHGLVQVRKGQNHWTSPTQVWPESMPTAQPKTPSPGLRPVRRRQFLRRLPHRIRGQGQQFLPVRLKPVRLVPSPPEPDAGVKPASERVLESWQGLSAPNGHCQPIQFAGHRVVVPLRAEGWPEWVQSWPAGNHRKLRAAPVHQRRRRRRPERASWENPHRIRAWKAARTARLRWSSW